MGNKIHTLRFRASDHEIFEAIKGGKKEVETRAATRKYQAISAGDTLRFICGDSEFTKRIVAVKKFNSIRELLDKYNPEDINPSIKTAEELEKMYYGFSGYKEKIEKYGLFAWELK